DERTIAPPTTGTRSPYKAIHPHRPQKVVRLQRPRVARSPGETLHPVQMILESRSPHSLLQGFLRRGVHTERHPPNTPNGTFFRLQRNAGVASIRTASRRYRRGCPNPVL